MVLSTAEKSYIYDSLAGKNSARTDSRKNNEFRPLKAVCSFVPNCNGSSRVYNPDGIECITSVKAKVIKTKDLSELINVDVDIEGQRDNSSLCLNLSAMIQRALVNNFEFEVLRLTDKYYFQLYVDILILSVPGDLKNSSYTLYSLLSLISMGTYLALKSAKLPLLTSTTNDREIEEEPSFADDWELATDLIPADSNYQPMLIFVVGLVGSNVLVDPSLDEEEVLENGLCIGYCQGNIVAPIQSIALSTADGKAFNRKTLNKALEMVKQIGQPVVEALESILNSEVDEYGSFF
ncbi:hypothetical protein KL930_002119 [Ogataea haglerorum]|nr:hypothetical protein KL915_001386 [Ogataea haglerorum]KAG7700696.1 hypothetical protein KL951_000811 [Ogataea haglerorum]KAG7710136.1 hypothetical protein KL914_001046 [Ogataea haglerorum]KAG7711083.1 hypothetical protein KL950_001049 [Ogataea haglerorum]KAG7720381.1 hypothetical protein KL913_001281 [Ogataea haglerorum]